MPTAVKSPKKVYKNLLMKKRQELLASARESEVLANSIQSPDEGDCAVKAADQAVAVATVDIRFRQLKEIDQALDRVREGTYGVCERCGADISLNRLKAIPWARSCVSCAEERSRN